MANSPWSVSPQKLAKTVIADTSKVMRFAALDILGQVIAVSPVDTGRFRGNWVVGLKVPDKNIKFVADGDTGASAYNDGQLIINTHVGLIDIWISNNLPYAERLNDGHSTQAPRNFVEIAVNKTAADVNRKKVIK